MILCIYMYIYKSVWYDDIVYLHVYLMLFPVSPGDTLYTTEWPAGTPEDKANSDISRQLPPEHGPVPRRPRTVSPPTPSTAS